jgi:hypothetical protein
VPSQGIGTALELAHGRAGGPPRVGFLLSPPYFPIQVSPARESPTETASSAPPAAT